MIYLLVVFLFFSYVSSSASSSLVCCSLFVCFLFGGELGVLGLGVLTGPKSCVCLVWGVSFGLLLVCCLLLFSVGGWVCSPSKILLFLCCLVCVSLEWCFFGVAWAWCDPCFVVFLWSVFLWSGVFFGVCWLGAGCAHHQAGGSHKMTPEWQHAVFWSGAGLLGATVGQREDPRIRPKKKDFGPSPFHTRPPCFCGAVCLRAVCG